ncbi:hypothetical protein BV22DRAFT_1117742 [Leucogyrophana mollusca]|uniref:Uncharacterized protein n=1 Tax=Leucogyrophana mollusca TaxID=85980 RepID=A0ACB8BRJ8_9AGAM|nr:hypothetical protein BV22DRAFT_1117742 [Leucogyrophana mollusca]
MTPAQPEATIILFKRLARPPMAAWRNGIASDYDQASTAYVKSGDCRSPYDSKASYFRYFAFSRSTRAITGVTHHWECMHFGNPEWLSLILPAGHWNAKRIVLCFVTSSNGARNRDSPCGGIGNPWRPHPTPTALSWNPIMPVTKKHELDTSALLGLRITHYSSICTRKESGDDEEPQLSK